MENQSSPPNAISILLATLDRDNRHIESFTLQNQQLSDQLSQAKREAEDRKADVEELLRRLQKKRRQLDEAIDIAILVKDVAHAHGWDDSTRYSDRKADEPHLFDLAIGFLSKITSRTEGASAPQAFVAVESEAPDAAPHTPRKDFNRDELTSSERYVFEQLAKAPTKDGDLASKIGRDGLFEKGLVVRFGGVNALSPSGVERGVEEGFWK